MTVQYLIDRMRAAFPQVAETVLLSDVNDIQRSFAEETDILHVLRRITVVNTSGTYTLIDDTAFNWTPTAMNDGGLKLTPPTSCISVLNVSSSASDKQDTSIYLAWRYMNGELTLYNRIGEEPIYTDTKYLEIEFSQYPTTLAALTTALDVPGIFHTALLAGVMMRYDAANLASWDALYRKEIVKAKQYVNKNRRGN